MHIYIYIFNQEESNLPWDPWVFLELVEFSKEAKREVGKLLLFLWLKRSKAWESRPSGRLPSVTVTCFPCLSLVPTLCPCGSQLLSPSLFQRTPDGFDSVPLKTSSGGPDMDLWEALPCLLPVAVTLQTCGTWGCQLPATPSSLWPYQKIELLIFVVCFGFLFFMEHQTLLSACLKPAKYTHTLYVWLPCLQLGFQKVQYPCWSRFHSSHLPELKTLFSSLCWREGPNGSFPGYMPSAYHLHKEAGDEGRDWPLLDPFVCAGSLNSTLLASQFKLGIKLARMRTR